MTKKATPKKKTKHVPEDLEINRRREWRFEFPLDAFVEGSLADGNKFVATPNFYVFEMYKPHQGAKAVRIAVDAPSIPVRGGNTELTLFGVAGSASVRDKTLTLTLVNPHASESTVAKVKLKGGSARSVRRTILTHADPAAHNTFENPNELTPQSNDVDVSGPGLTLELPSKSITRWDITLG